MLYRAPHLGEKKKEKEKEEERKRSWQAAEVGVGSGPLAHSLVWSRQES